ncbi:MAG: hypothetical protein WCT50_04330 [Patescibacteria group bacterium]|jgi:hypothetical protein
MADNIKINGSRAGFNEQPGNDLLDSEEFDDEADMADEFEEESSNGKSRSSNRQSQANQIKNKTGSDERFDSSLMNPGESSSDKAGALNEAKRKEKSGAPDQANPQEEPQTLREAVIAAKREEAAKDKKEEEGEGGIKSKFSAQIRKTTSKWLCDSWINLWDSFGLTLFYINFHVFARLVVGKSWFCKLGEEWLESGIIGGTNELKDAVLGKTLSKYTDKANTCSNIGESTVLGILDFALLLVIFINLAIIGAMLQVFENPMAFIGQIFGWVWDSTIGGITNVSS